MAFEKQNRHENEQNNTVDDFWDIDALIPQRRLPPTSADTSTTEIVLEPRTMEKRTGEQEKSANAQRRFIPPHTEEERRVREAEDEYVPQNSLIKRVRIFKPQSNYNYYDSFLRDAERLYTVKGRETSPVSFFSYVPQYTQMDRGQLEWYLWWRECFRNGTCLPTDYSYLLLYAYEMINLAERIGPEVAQGELCKLWSGYRDLFHQFLNQQEHPIQLAGGGKLIQCLGYDILNCLPGA